MSMAISDYKTVYHEQPDYQLPVLPSVALRSDQKMQELVSYLHIIFVSDLEDLIIDNLIKKLWAAAQNDQSLSVEKKQLFVAKAFCLIIDEYNFPNETIEIFHRSITDLLEAIESLLEKRDAFFTSSDMDSWPDRDRENFLIEQSKLLLDRFQASIYAKNATPLLFSIYRIRGLENLTPAERRRLRMNLAADALNRIFPHHDIDAAEKTKFKTFTHIAPSFFSLFEAAEKGDIPLIDPPFESGCCALS